jgi:hypothetical protein
MAMVMTDADAATATATADAATATATATADAATATVDADSVTATAAEKPKHAEKPDYAPYNGASTADGGTGTRVRRGGGAVDSVVARWRREDMLDKSPLALHAAAAVFAFVALVLVASNQHGDWMQFDRYQEYKCVSGRRLLGVRPWRALRLVFICLWIIAASSLSLGTCFPSRRWRYSTRWRRRRGTRTGCAAASTPSPQHLGGFLISLVIRRVIASNF